jgi:hypothetical protein
LGHQAIEQMYVYISVFHRTPTVDPLLQVGNAGGESDAQFGSDRFCAAG